MLAHRRSGFQRSNRRRSTPSFKSDRWARDCPRRWSDFSAPDGPLWVGYQVQALPRTHLSACSSWTDRHRWKMDAAMNIDWRTRSDNLNTSDQKDAVDPVIYVLLRHRSRRAIEKIRLAPAGCTLNAGGLTSAVAHRRPARRQRGLPRSDCREAREDERRDKLVDESLVAVSMHATPKATEVLATLALFRPIPPIFAKRPHSGLARNAVTRDPSRFSSLLRRNKTQSFARSSPSTYPSTAIPPQPMS